MRKPHFHGNRNQSTQIEPSMKGPDKEKLKSLMKFLQSRQFDKVLDTSSKMLSESLITSHVYNFRGAAFSQLNKFESAVSSFESAIIIDPENAYAHCNMSNSLQLMGDLVNAAQSCQRAGLLVQVNRRARSSPSPELMLRSLHAEGGPRVGLRSLQVPLAPAWDLW